MVHKKIDEQLNTLFWITLLNIKQTQIYGSLSIAYNTSFSQSKPALPPTVLLMSLNIILQGAASAHLLRWPNIMQFKYLAKRSYILSVFISGTCHIQQ
jgi:hypothetical protein